MKATGKRGSPHAPPTNPFQPGHGKPGPGRPRMDPEFRQLLKADTMPRYLRLKALSEKAEAAKDYKTAANIELALFRKQVPDLSAVELTGEDGGPLAVRATLDVTKLTADELKALRAMQEKALK